MDRSLDISLPRPQRRPFSKCLLGLITAIGANLERARTRRLLAQLNEQQLSDIGISPSDRMAELDKPFWR